MMETSLFGQLTKEKTAKKKQKHKKTTPSEKAQKNTKNFMPKLIPK